MKNVEVKVDMLINNQQFPVKKYAEICDPGRLTDVVGEVAVGNAGDVDRAVQAAYRAFRDWSKTDIK